MSNFLNQIRKTIAAVWRAGSVVAHTPPPHDLDLSPWLAKVDNAFQTEPPASPVVTFQSSYNTVTYPLAGVSVPAYRTKTGNLYEVQLFVDQSAYPFFGDAHESSTFTLSLILPIDISAGDYPIEQGCDHDLSNRAVCIGISLYDAAGVVQGGKVRITRDGDQVSARFAFISYVDRSFEGPINDILLVTGTFEGVALP